MKITNYCCLDKNESTTLDNIKPKINVDYKIINLCSQKEGIQYIFNEYKEKGFLNEIQIKELFKKLNKLKDKDFFNLQESLKTPKKMIFEESDFKKNYEVVKGEKQKLYYLLMQLNFYLMKLEDK